MSSGKYARKTELGQACILLIATIWSFGVLAENLFNGHTTFYASIGSSDVYRGIMRSERDAALQVGASIQFDHLSYGVSVHDAQFSGPFGKQSDETEVNYFIAYSRTVSERLSWQLQFKTYTFPGSSDEFFEYDYNELALTLEMPSEFTWSLGTSDTSASFAQGIAYSELTWRRALQHGLEFSAGIGGVRSLSGERNGYAYWDVGVSRLVKSVAIDLRYHYSPYDENWFGRTPARGEWVLSLTKGWSN